METLRTTGEGLGFKGSFGRFAISVVAVFVPLMILADFAPGMALLMAAAVGLMFAFSWHERIAELVKGPL